VGRSILVIIWHLLANPEARYVDLGPGWHARKLDIDRRTRSLLNQLRALHPDSDITITAAA
jgi:transposase